MGKQKNFYRNRLPEPENNFCSIMKHRKPIMLRVEGKSFRVFTQGLEKPFDYVLMETMLDTMKYLCEHIPGCVFGYTQSDEIVLILSNDTAFVTDTWLKYSIQEISNATSSMATLAFNMFFRDNAEAALQYADTESSIERCMDFNFRQYEKKFDTARFDACGLFIPQEEICNCLISCQRDAIYNSIISVGQANFSQEQLHGKHYIMIKDMLWSEKRIKWDDFPSIYKKGSCCYCNTGQITGFDPQNDGRSVDVTRNIWVIDREIPFFSKERNFVEQKLSFSRR